MLDESQSMQSLTCLVIADPNAIVQDIKSKDMIDEGLWFWMVIWNSKDLDEKKKRKWVVWNDSNCLPTCVNISFNRMYWGAASNAASKWRRGREPSMQFPVMLSSSIVWTGWRNWLVHEWEGWIRFECPTIVCKELDRGSVWCFGEPKI